MLGGRWWSSFGSIRAGREGRGEERKGGEGAWNRVLRVLGLAGVLRGGA